jgi:5-methylthioadenosine/S-adenosylhomocysteine deaminase
MDPSNVDTVLVAGRVRKRAGRLLGVDMARLAQQVGACRDRVFERAGRKPPMALTA